MRCYFLDFVFASHVFVPSSLPHYCHYNELRLPGAGCDYCLDQYWMGIIWSEDIHLLGDGKGRKLYGCWYCSLWLASSFELSYRRNLALSISLGTSFLLAALDGPN